MIPVFPNGLSIQFLIFLSIAFYECYGFARIMLHIARKTVFFTETRHFGNDY